MSGGDKSSIDDLFDPMEGDSLECGEPEPRPKSKSKAKPKTGWKRHYTMVPDWWVRQLHKARRVSTYRLAHELLYLHWKAKNDGEDDEDIVVADEVAKMADISRASKFNALAELEHLGLIRTTREPGKAPRAELLHAKLPRTI
jgi:hypothetical protein